MYRYIYRQLWQGPVSSVYVPAALVLPQLHLSIASDFAGRNKTVHLVKNKIFILFFKLDLFPNQKRKKMAAAKD